MDDKLESALNQRDALGNTVLDLERQVASLIAERDEARAEASKWETIAKRLANIEPQIDSLKQQLADYESKSENWLEFERKAEARGMERAAEIADSYAGTSLAAVDIAADIRRLKDNPHG